MYLFLIEFLATSELSCKILNLHHIVEVCCCQFFDWFKHVFFHMCVKWEFIFIADVWKATHRLILLYDYFTGDQF